MSWILVFNLFVWKLLIIYNWDVSEICSIFEESSAAVCYDGNLLLHLHYHSHDPRALPNFQ